MKRLAIYLFVFQFGLLSGQYPDGAELLEKMDQNMSSKSRIFTSTMIIHGVRGQRFIQSKTWSEGEDKAFTEYLSPAREEGTKMLKLEDALWIYSPSSDRTIQIAGHMLRQSVMGSDMSYEDLMEDSRYLDNYHALVTGTSTLNDRNCWVLELTALNESVNYHKRIQWVDQEWLIPLKEELYAKSGKLLKKTDLSDVRRIQGRWFPFKIVFRDMLKTGDGTEFIIDEIVLDPPIDPMIFTKGSLKR